MRIDATVTHVGRSKHWSTETLVVRADVDVGPGFVGRSVESITLHVPSTKHTRRSFFVGREIAIDVTVKGR